MIKYAQEILNDVKAEALPLLLSHYEEIALNKDIIDFNPDWDLYQKYEDLGILKIFTARDEDRLVGYFVVIATPHLHYKDHIFAYNDIIYVNPQYRKGFTAWRLIKYAEKEMKDQGATIMIVNSKRHKPFDILLERLGFSHIESIFSKRLV